MLYTIGETARKVNLTAYTLRYYDREGLLPFVDRSASGIRMFKETDFEWLHLIECLKHTGMPIKQIREFIDQYREGDSTLEKRRDMFYERKRIVEQELAALQETLDTLTYKCWFYDKAVETGSAAVPKNMKMEELPPEIRKLKANL